MSDHLEGKVVLVTGGGSGIGLATAQCFARAGARVVVADVVGQRAIEAEEGIRAAGGHAISVAADVSREADVRRMIHLVIETYGRLDCAFNNAGYANTPAPTAELDLATWQNVIAVNLTGIFLCLKYEIQEMLKTGGGAIVNTSSVTGLQGMATLGAYSASKHGIIGLTRTAAVEYATRGIRINAIAPGLVDTPAYRAAVATGVDAADYMNLPMGRAARTMEIAEAVVFMCSPRASYMTGQVMVVDGGNTAG